MRYVSSQTQIKVYTCSIGLRARPGEFNIPHSLALDEARGLLYVADRENGRIQCFDTHGKFKMQIRHEEFGGRLFAVSFTPANGEAISYICFLLVLLDSTSVCICPSRGYYHSKIK